MAVELLFIIVLFNMFQTPGTTGLGMIYYAFNENWNLIVISLLICCKIWETAICEKNRLCSNMFNTEKILVSDYRGINNTMSYRTFPLCESQIVIIHDIFIPSMFFATIRKIWRNRKHTIIEFLKKHDFAFYSKYIQIWLQIIKPPIHTPTQRL